MMDWTCLTGADRNRIKLIPWIETNNKIAIGWRMLARCRNEIEPIPWIETNLSR